MSKQLYTLEFPVRCSPSILFEFLSTPAGLGEWFADKVDERDNIFYFGWNVAFEKAEVMEIEQDKYMGEHPFSLVITIQENTKTGNLYNGLVAENELFAISELQVDMDATQQLDLFGDI